MYKKVSKAVEEERCCEKGYKYVQRKSHCFSVRDRMGWGERYTRCRTKVKKDTVGMYTATEPTHAPTNESRDRNVRNGKNNVQEVGTGRKKHGAER